MKSKEGDLYHECVCKTWFFQDTKKCKIYLFKCPDCDYVWKNPDFVKSTLLENFKVNFVLFFNANLVLSVKFVFKKQEGVLI